MSGQRSQGNMDQAGMDSKYFNVLFFLQNVNEMKLNK